MLFQKGTFEKILQQMAGHEGVPQERMVMFLDDRLIEPYDTPLSLGLHIADIIGKS